jgi:hypothetical protein
VFGFARVFSFVAALVACTSAIALAAAAIAPDAPAKRAGKAGKKAEEPLALPAELVVPSYSAGELPLGDGQRLVFQASWLGIPAADARIELRASADDPDELIAEAWMETNAFVDIFYRMRNYVKEKLSRPTLETRALYIRHQENRRLNEYFVDFDRPAALVSAVKKNSKGSSEKRFIAPNGWGPISGALMALSQPVEPGTTLMFDVITGSQRYVFDFNVKKIERITVPAGTFEAYRVVPGVVYLSDESLREKSRQMTVWVSADKRRLPLRVEAGTFVGSIRADLVRIENTKLAAR